jgi:hypothetical protein
MSDEIARMDVALGPPVGPYGHPRTWVERCPACTQGRESDCTNEDLGHSCIQRIQWNYGSCQHNEVLFGSVDQNGVGRCAHCGFLVSA